MAPPSNSTASVATVSAGPRAVGAPAPAAAGAPRLPKVPSTPNVLQTLPGSLRRAQIEQVALALFIAVPFAAVVAAVPVAWGWGLTWHDLLLAFVLYAISGHGVTVGYHRFFTHKSFKARRPVRVALAVAGSLAIEGPVIRWVADHRRHHAFSDRDGDPHSPWRYGTSTGALAKGLWHAHIGWLFDVEQTNQARFAPDLLADRDIRRVSRSFPWLVAVSLLAAPLAGGLWSMSWQGAVTAFFWASLVRVALLHHTTWSINSICHWIGERPFRSRDKAGNVWWLAIPSMGESWHNLHHADPTSARHGAMRGQLDSSARIIWVLERLHCVSDVRWPSPERLAGKLVANRLPAAQDSAVA
jgi:stearoyl-CoA desaturase (delta-9 desaturase)